MTHLVNKNLCIIHEKYSGRSPEPSRDKEIYETAKETLMYRSVLWTL